jgi:hypothetical protein
MNHARQGAVQIFLGIALLFCLTGFPARAQKKKNTCKHPPKIVFQPKFPEEDQRKWKGKPVSGKIGVIVSEEGDVAEARVLAASPKEAAESLQNTVKQMKFEPRPGCGEFKTEVFFSLDR